MFGKQIEKSDYFYRMTKKDSIFILFKTFFKTFLSFNNFKVKLSDFLKKISYLFQLNLLASFQFNFSVSLFKSRNLKLVQMDNAWDTKES